MAAEIHIALAQLNFHVGDVPGNAARIISAMDDARAAGADLVLFSELALCGYPPEDLLFRNGFRRQVSAELDRVRDASTGIATLVGYPLYEDGVIYNAADLLVDGVRRATYRKQCLPNYGVFDEARYFARGDIPVVADIAGVPVGITICEDVWEPEPAARAAAAGARILVSINGSPYEVDKQARRENVLAQRVSESGLPIVYQNCVGGQDELVFDGGSCVMDASGQVTMRAPAFEEGMHLVAFTAEGGRAVPRPGAVEPLPEEIPSIYRALVTGVRDYVRKNGFPGVVLGLSGGIDSALTLAIAADALGPEAVQAVMMPYTYTADISIEDAEGQAKLLGTGYEVIPIAPMVEAASASLAELFAGLPADTTEENIQSRCRGVLLMAISNKTGRMVLATGNKSEMAVGYATLYGDMCGGYAPIKDCNKTLVYQLARYRNSVSPAIPERVITRPPSAELRPDQLDTDSLPPYDVLDPILDAMMVHNNSVEDIVALGYERPVVARVLEMVRRNEYKRRQAPPGVRISARAFGRDWRYPITSGYKFRM